MTLSSSQRRLGKTIEADNKGNGALLIRLTHGVEQLKLQSISVMVTLKIRPSSSFELPMERDSGNGGLGWSYHRFMRSVCLELIEEKIRAVKSGLRGCVFEVIKTGVLV